MKTSISIEHFGGRRQEFEVVRLLARLLFLALSSLVCWQPAIAFERFVTLKDGYLYDGNTPWIPHGIAYQTWNRPLGVWQTHDQLDYDLDEMVKLGANCLRVDFVWQHIEAQGDNQFNWTNYDYLVSACERRGLRLIPLIGYQWPPSWFPFDWYTMHPPAVDSEGIFHPQRWRSDIINYEHPQARTQYAEFLQTVCRRYKDSKAIVAWVIGNEYGYLGLWSGLLDGYDPYCEEAFRTWCQTRFGNIASINARWGSSYTNFAAIALLEEYQQYGKEGAQWADMIQWREDSIAAFSALGAAAARSGDTNHLLTYSTVGMQWGEEDWRYHAEDRGKITRACSAAGAPLSFFSVNNYPWAILGHESHNGQWGVSFTKKVTGIPVLYSETGFTSTETLWPGMDAYQQGILARNSLWEGFEAGAIGTHLFTWQDRPYITPREAGFGICTADRRVKDSFWPIRDTFTLMDQVRLAELIAGSSDPKPDIAFLWTAANDSQYNRYETEMQQEAGAFERLGFEPNFMDLNELASGAFTNYRAIVLPRNMRVDDQVPGTSIGVMQFIREKVLSAGVHVLATSDLPGMQDQNGNPLASFIPEVEAVFGVNAGNAGGYEVPERWGSHVFDSWRRISVRFTTNAPGILGFGYSYAPEIWKYNDEIRVTDGKVWAVMDTHRNKGFEDNDSSVGSSWGAWGEVHVRHNLGWQYDGQNMVQMWGDSGIFADFQAVPGARYTSSAFLRSNGDDPLRNGKHAFVAIEWYNKANQLITTSESTHLTSSTPSNSWVSYIVDTNAPPSVWYGRRIVRIKGSGDGSLFVDNQQEGPAIIVKNHGTAKAALVAYSPGDMSPDGDGDGEMDSLPWKWRRDVFGAIMEDYFGLQPSFHVLGTNAHLCLAEYRTLKDGSTLWQIKNYAYDRSQVRGGEAQIFTITSPLFLGKTIEAFLGGSILATNSDGLLSLTLPANGMEILHVYQFNQTNSPGSPQQWHSIVHITDFPASVHPFGDKTYAIRVKHDSGVQTNLILHLAFMEADNNGDSIANEIYQQSARLVSGTSEEVFNLWIPDPDLSDTDYLSSEEGGRYVFKAWLATTNGEVLAESNPAPVELQWGVRPVGIMPSTVHLDEQVTLNAKYENLPEYLWWETTPLRRNEVFPGRVAIFRSNKTEANFPGHLEKVNRVADWLESLGYVNGDDLEVAFANIQVSQGVVSEPISTSDLGRWTRIAGSANWDTSQGTLRAWRIGNDDNILAAGEPGWSNYTVQASIRYNHLGPYFNDAEVYFRYQDRDNYCKVGIQNFYGMWRLKYTIRVNGDNATHAWLHEFPKADQPIESKWYTLSIQAQGATFTVTFDGTTVGTFTDAHFSTGKIGVGTRAVQLGISEPKQGYYFIDDDEYSYYAAGGSSATKGTPLELSSGYLSGFFPTLILPGTHVMSDVEVSNVVGWLGSGKNSLIVTDGGIAVQNERGESAPGRIEASLGVAPAIQSLQNLSSLKIGPHLHYVTLDYTNGTDIPIAGTAMGYTTLTTGTALGSVSSATAVLPGLIVNTPPNADSNAPAKVFTFNFEPANGAQLQQELKFIAQRAFEWSRIEAYKLRAELKHIVNATHPSTDLILLSQDIWLLGSGGISPFSFHIPDAGIMTGTNMYWVFYIYPWESPEPWRDHLGFYSSANDSQNGKVTVTGKDGQVFVVYADSGIPPASQLFTWQFSAATYDGNHPDVTSPEGANSFYANAGLGWFGWGVFKQTDLSLYARGHLRFWLKSTGSLALELEGPPGTKRSMLLPSTTNVWQEFAIAITNFSGIDLSRCYGLFLITSETPSTFYVDNVRWIERPADVDRDGMFDDWERFYFGNLLRSGEADWDLDGNSDLEEFIAGTNPRDAGSTLKLRLRKLQEGNVSLEFDGIKGHTYALEESSPLTPSLWTPTFTTGAISNNTVISILRPILESNARFFRVSTVAVP